MGQIWLEKYIWTVWTNFQGQYFRKQNLRSKICRVLNSKANKGAQILVSISPPDTSEGEAEWKSERLTMYSLCGVCDIDRCSYILKPNHHQCGEKYPSLFIFVFSMAPSPYLAWWLAVPNNSRSRSPVYYPTIWSALLHWIVVVKFVAYIVDKDILSCEVWYDMILYGLVCVGTLFQYIMVWLCTVCRRQGRTL